MNRKIRHLSLVPALLVLGLPTIANAAPEVDWSHDYTFFDTDQLGASSAFAMLNVIPGFNLNARVASDMNLSGKMTSSMTSFEAVGKVTLNASGGPFSIRSAPDVDAYAEWDGPTGQPGTYQVHIKYTDFAGNTTDVVNPPPTANPLSFDLSPFMSANTNQVTWTSNGLEVDFTPVLYVGGTVHASVDPSNGIVVNAAVQPGVTLSAQTYALGVGVATGQTELFDFPGDGYAANAKVNASVAPAQEPMTNYLGLCLNANATWGLEHAFEASYAVVGVGGSSFPGVGPGDNQPLGAQQACWDPTDNKTWSSTMGTGAWYGTGALANMMAPSCQPGATTCPAGVSGVAPQLPITCAGSANFYDSQGTPLASGPSYSATTSSYGGQVWACGGPYGGADCVSFSIYAPTLCSSTSGSSSGGGYTGGKFGCKGICQ
jgi:hypothetical protein